MRHAHLLRAESNYRVRHASGTVRSKAANPCNGRRFSFDYFDMLAGSVHRWRPASADFEIRETNRFLLAAGLCLALTGTVGATEGPWQG